MNLVREDEVPRRALVTGASRGIGAGIAQMLAIEGCRVILNYREDRESAEAVLSRIREKGGQAELAQFDVRDAEATSTSLSRLGVEDDPIEILVNNAGVAADGPFVGMKREAWDRVVETGIGGFFNVTRPLVMPMMRGRWGRIINLVSLAGVLGQRGQVNYATAKAGLIGATKALARELASRSITVNAVCPGWIATDMLKNLPQEALVTRIPLGRLGAPEDIARAVRFLVSSGADYVTGQVLTVDGGLHL